MFSTPTKFDNYVGRLDSIAGVIVKIVFDSTTYLFGNMELPDLSDGYVYPVVKDFKVGNKTNVLNKDYSRCVATVDLFNHKYRLDTSGNKVRVSDQLSDIQNAPITIYCFNNPNIASLSDCLVSFIGIAQRGPIYNKDVLTIKCTDTSDILETIIPLNYLPDAFDSTPLSGRDLRAPLVYGEFSFDLEDRALGMGLAKGFVVESKTLPLVMFSDHALKEITLLYNLHSKLPLPSKCNNVTLTANNGGYGTGIQTTDLEWAYLYPKGGGEITEDYQLSISEVVNFHQAINRESGNYAEIRDNIDAGSYRRGNITFTWDNYARQNVNSLIGNDVGYLLGEGGGDPYYFYFIIKADEHSGVTITTSDLRLYYDKGGGTDDYEDLGALTLNTSYNEYASDVTAGGTEWRTEIIWHPLDGKDNKSGTGTLPIMLVIYCQASGGDSTTDNSSLIDVFGVYLRLYYKSNEHENYWAVCKGLVYDTWINSRSSNYSSGDLIEDPAGIIESILRDVLGLSSSDIDLTSFIGAEDTNMKLRVNLHDHNQKTARNKIREIAQQSNFLFNFNAIGEAKLIPLTETSPTSDRTFHIDRIKGRDIKPYQSSVILNDVDIFANFQQETETYAYENSIADSSSITQFGSHTAEIRWNDVGNATTIDELEKFYFEDGSNVTMLNCPHVVVEFETVGVDDFDLDIGDYIDFDSGSVDPVILYPGGASWSGKEFLVFDYDKRLDGVKIRAIEYYATP